MPRFSRLALRHRLSHSYLGHHALMSHDVEQWFSDPNCGADWQDMDLLLAQPEYLPRLKAYLAQPDAPEFKKIEALSALLELLEHECSVEGNPKADRLAYDIRSTIRRHHDAAQAAMPQLGPVKEIVLRKLLGLPIPPEYPEWVINQASRGGAGA